MIPEEQPQLTFRHTRVLTGIIGHETRPTARPSTTVLGAAADEYLWAHGYEPGSVRVIQRLYERARGMNEFVDELAAAGVSITEARYIFNLIHDTEI